MALNPIMQKLLDKQMEVKGVVQNNQMTFMVNDDNGNPVEIYKDFEPNRKEGPLPVLPEGTEILVKYFITNDKSALESKCVHVNSCTPIVTKKIKTESKKPVQDVIIWDNNVVVSKRTNFAMRMAHKAMEQQGWSASRVTGPSGIGKTSTIVAFAKQHGIDYIIVDFGNLNENGMLFGETGFKDGQTYFEESEFTQMIKRGNCVIIFDEINRAPQDITNNLIGLVSHVGKTTYKGKSIKRGDNIMFFGTMNLGSSYSGTFQLDGAIARRFEMNIPVDKPTKEELIRIISLNVKDISLNDSNTVATVTVDLIEHIKNALKSDIVFPIEIATSHAISIARYVKLGANVRTALELVVGCSIPEEDTTNRQQFENFCRQRSNIIGEINYE